MKFIILRITRVEKLRILTRVLTASVATYYELAQDTSNILSSYLIILYYINIILCYPVSLPDRIKE